MSPAETRVRNPRTSGALAGLSALVHTAALLSIAPLNAAPTAADPQALPATRALLQFFHDLRTRTNAYILSGQFANFGRPPHLELLQRIHERTGEWPAILGLDYADFARGSLTFAEANAAAIEWARQGGLVHLSAHLYNPANPQGGGLRDPGVDLAELLHEGTESHRRWLEELDLLAAGLQELQKANVTVLWRPFHEMNGAWFWWGGKDPAAFIALWRQMFERFTKHHRLHHLLWVYGPNHGEKTAAYYPGDAYVDLVGLDAYTDFIDPTHIRGYPEIVALGKPFGFTEYGPHGSRNPPGNYDYRKFITGLLEHFPETRFFMCWNDRWSLAANEHVTELLRHPAVLNRGGLPSGLRSPPKPTTR